MPALPALSEADAVDAEAFLSDVLLCLPVVGVSFFEKAKAETARTTELYLRAKGIEARGVDTADGFVVREGSHAVKEEAPTIHNYMSELRRVLVEKGVFADAGATFRLTQDYVFGSPSTASGVLLGRTSNGRAEWKDANGTTLKQIQDGELDGADAG